MSPRLALWCPHGRSGLDLAAHLLIEQLPAAGSIVWSSDVPWPAEPPESPEIELWLVICGGDPPPPPQWMEPHAGVRAVFPGTANQWSETTEAALAAWRGAVVLTDLLPDECDNPVLRACYERGVLAWLPVVLRAPPRLVEQNGFAVAESGELLARYGLGPTTRAKAGIGSPPASTGVAERIPDRLVMLSKDAVSSSVLLQFASACGVGVVVAGEPGSVARQILLGGEPADRVQWGTEFRLRPVLQRFLGSSGKASSRAFASTFSWDDWAEALVDSTRPARGVGGAVARFFSENRAARRKLGHEWPMGAPPTMDKKLPFVLYPRLVSNPAALEHLAGCTPEAWWFHYVGTLVERDSDWVQAAVARAMEENHVNIARLLWYAVCDGFCTRDKHDVTAAVAAVFAAMPQRLDDVEEWPAVRAAALAATGNFSAASVELDRLRRGQPAVATGALLEVLRAWAPTLDGSEDQVLPSAAQRWWLAEAEAGVSAGAPNAAAVKARGELWLGDPEAMVQLAKSSSFAVETLAELAVACWIRRLPELGKRIWTSAHAVVRPAAAAGCLSALVARSLYEPPSIAMAAELKQFGSSEPELFLPERPSHTRCFLLALGLLHAGAPDDAAVWRARAAEQDPLALRRWQRLHK